MSKTPREEFESQFGSITDDQWQWLKEFCLRNPITGGSVEWDASQGANPETCQHRVVQHAIVWINRELNTYEEIPICVSCDSTLDESFMAQRVDCYDYDIDNNVWVYYGPRSKRRRV